MKRVSTSLLLLGACSGGSSATVTIAPYRVPCFGLGPTTCLEGTRPDGTVERFFGGFDGFTFRWGETHELSFVTHEIEDPPLDGSSIRREVIDDVLVSTSAPDDEFVLAFPDTSEPWFFDVGATNLVGFFGETIACEPALCDTLETQLGAYSLRLAFGAPAGAVATVLAFE